MIGGFLGAGKTTAVAQLARRLTDAGKRVGLITNDQGRELVDTKMLRSLGFATEEIPGGCFCCRFNSLVEAAQNLAAGAAPDVFIAEPVGSCTDLVATVTYPLRRIYGERFEIAPLSVLVDPVRARRVFGLDDGGNFSEKVVYIYKKQLEEADIIVINKRDLLPAAQIDELDTALRAAFPHAEVVAVSARHEDGLDPWFETLASGATQAIRRTMEIDYDIYADGEALLGWLNATVDVAAPEGVDADDLLQTLAREVQDRLRDRDAEVAHFKMTLSAAESLAGEVAILNLVRNDFVPELCQRLDDDVTRAQVIVNLRAEAAPEDLATILREALDATAAAHGRATLTLDHKEYFRPGRPTPTHRDLVEA
ncbi:MAG: cobalamin biosynthesis protein P47K [Akkermansiaceae bacterium]|nr:cobalamin biosynthesis protein P47K [Akkermansiaceae bacterium]MCP5551099.1 cobalamin biosynthesis protein P47K [Akkermansiaceae bacterium]